MHAFLSNVVVEPLEARQQFAAVYPSPVEQYAVELINRARANPTAEAERYVGFTDGHGNTYDGDLNEGLPDGTISAAAKQPVAINPNLTDAARQHSEWMIANSTFSHYGEGGDNPGQRIAAAGDAANNWGENIAINYSGGTLDALGTATDQQRNLFTDQTESDRGHRTNMLDPTRNEIGVGFASGPYSYPGVGSVNALASTQDTADNGQVFLTGVAYNDAVSADQFYTPGEGLGGITVTAKNTATGTAYTAQTWASGGYSLPLPAGTYDVTGSGTGLTGVIAYSGVTIGSQNVKEDFVTGQTGGTTLVPTTDVRDRTLVITGTVGNDVIGVYVDADSRQYVVGLSGVVSRFDQSLIDAVAVQAGDGNDRVVIGDGVAHSYVEGGAGKDTLIGGPGQDTLYGNGGIDRVEGNAGNDLLVGENGNDLIYGGLGNDRIYGGAGNDTIYGENGNDRIYGGIGNDLISAGRGRDYLIGERGADTLDGGPHNDHTDNDPDDTRIADEVLV